MNVTKVGKIASRLKFSTLAPPIPGAPSAKNVEMGAIRAATVDHAVGYWLLGCAGMVAGMVSVGGLTRLTKSGLSMTDWQPLGRLPPMNHAEWVEEFEKYKTFPEWQQRKSMTLDEFKYIFWWEYGHRMLGRTVGVAFGGPMLYFLARGRIPAQLRARVGGLFALGGAQGLIGAWMVQSGLEMDPAQRREIRVSPYRLATHLGMAFTTYSLLVWTGLDVLRPQANMQRVAAEAAAEGAAGAAGAAARLQSLGKVRSAATLTAGLVFATALSGAFVAGNDAGRAFNHFPKMEEGRWVPREVLALAPAWRNPFENTACVQFDHRALALATTASVASTLAVAGAGGWRGLPRVTQLSLSGMGAMVGVQVALGVSTLLLYVPTELAAAHQAGSLVLLTLALSAAHSLKGAPFSAKAPVALAGVGAFAFPVFAVLANAESEEQKTQVTK